MSNYDRYYTLDEPVPYKSIKLYPIKVRDYESFYSCIQALVLEKNSISDVKIISMSYLEYLYYLHDTIKEINGIDYLLLLDFLLKLCMRNDKLKIRYGRDNKEKPILEIEKEIFDETDFEEIRDIICKQNLVDIPDEAMQKDVRDLLKEAREYRAKISGNKPASFEDTILCLVASTSMTLEQVYNLSIRKFIKLLQRIDALIHYKIYLGAAMSGMVEIKDKSILRHWMSDLEKENKNEDIMLDLDQLKEKVGNKL